MRDGTFRQEDWEHIHRDYVAWWNHDLDRPLVQVTAPGLPVGRRRHLPACPIIPCQHRLGQRAGWLGQQVATALGDGLGQAMVTAERHQLVSGVQHQALIGVVIVRTSVSAAERMSRDTPCPSFGIC